ncbi:MAG TPA: galactitol-1-phosphate 5-dehydrogenase [Candidatus Binatia bacterium]|jgi:L-iditol 2-dehydrogenase|nr:galactitol-1-phosphate 5-dehydrogenase [Candidatus Binatia bacterium]
MKALVLKEYKRLAYEEVPPPQPGPGEVLVAVKACGICGSDVHGIDGSTGRRRPPIIMGHEAAGVLVGLATGIDGWKEGERVTFDSTLYCGQCDYCRRGEFNLCDRRQVLGVSCEDYRRHGAFAEFVAVPRHVLYRLPEGLPFEHAAMVEPFAIALHAVRRAPPALNDTVVVVGAGMIGLALLQALSHTGCSLLISVDVADDRLALAGKLGATHLINSSKENASEAILRLTRNHGADLALEAVGLTPTVDLALRCVRKGGAVTLVGNVAPKIEFPLQIAVTRELTVYGSCASRGEYPACLEMMARGALQAAPLLSAAAPLAEGAAWFDRLYRKEPGLLKVVLKP